jgi:cytochrome c
MRRNRSVILLSATMLCLASGVALADERGSKDEAKALLDRAVAHVQEVGADTAFADFTRKDGGFIDRDLYVYCFDMHGAAVAHGGNPGLVGKNLSGMKDPDGVQPVEESIKIAQTTGEGWLDFKWPNPVTKKVEAKQAYVKRVGDAWCGVGFYK